MDEFDRTYQAFKSSIRTYDYLTKVLNSMDISCPFICGSRLVPYLEKHFKHLEKKVGMEKRCQRA